MFSSVLIANRGEIARRVIRTARRMGIRAIAVYSEADASLPYVHEADEAVYIGEPAPAQSYLDSVLLLDVARKTGAAAVHPGYGFLAESPGFAAAIRLRARILSPICSMASGAGPIQVRPAAITAVANPGLSARNP